MGCSAIARSMSCSAIASVCPGSAYIRSRLKLSKPASCASFTAASACALSWMRPRRCRQPSSKLWMPKLNAVHAGGAIMLEAAMLGGAGIGFQRDLEVRCEAQARAGRLQERIDRFRREQRRRAAAEEHRVHGAAPCQRQVVVEVGDQCIDIGRERQRALRLVRIEIAIRTLAHAPGQVHVERERRSGEHGPMRNPAGAASTPPAPSTMADAGS